MNAFLLFEFFDDSGLPDFCHTFGSRTLSQLKYKTFEVFIELINFMDMCFFHDFRFFTRLKSLHYFFSQNLLSFYYRINIIVFFHLAELFEHPSQSLELLIDSIFFRNSKDDMKNFFWMRFGLQKSIPKLNDQILAIIII